MLRIIGIQRSDDAQGEFVLLHNQGILKVQLRGHMVADEEGLLNLDPDRMFSFTDEELIPAGCYVILVSGEGIGGWRKSADGSHIYHVYWNRRTPAWADEESPMHLLNIVHTNRPRAEGLLISR